jgi:hypothetical protein
VNPDRIVSTGISLGSNSSIAYGAAHPDWFSAIVPVSTEGDSRERLLRNLATVPTYVLEGSQDRNIRGVGGPRSLDLIMTGLGLDLVYREFGDRAHEGFQEHYAEVLRWLDVKPRRSDPAEVWRVPHSGIMPLARSVHWIESATRQGVIHARVMDPQRIDIRAARTDELTVYLNDGIVNLDRPIEIWVNGEIAFEGRVPRSIPFALERARELQDERRIYSGSVTVAVPTGREANRISGEVSAEVVPNFPEGTLSFWEMYAVRALEERFPVLGFSGVVARFPESGGGPAHPVGAGQVAVRVTEVTSGSPWEGSDLRVGDLVLEVGREPLLVGSEKGDPLLALREWLLRELRGYPQDYSVRILRGNQEIRLQVPLSLGDYTPASD